MSSEYDLGPNRTTIPAEVFAAGLPKNKNAFKDPSEVAKDLHPDDVIVLEELSKAREVRNDRDAAIILHKLRIEDSKSIFPPEKS